MIREKKTKKINNLIKRIRIDNDLTQDELAQKIYVSRQLISNWEKNNIVPGNYMIELICKELNISRKTLLFKYGYGRKKFIRHCLNVILLFLISLLIVSLLANCLRVDIFVGNINNSKMIMTDSIFIQSKGRKTLYLGSILNNKNNFERIKIYYNADGNFTNVYEGKYKYNIRLDELSNYQEYFKNNFNINDLFIEFVNDKNNVVDSYKFTFDNIHYQDKLFSLFNKKVANSNNDSLNSDTINDDILLANGYNPKDENSEIYMNNNFKYSKNDNSLVYYDNSLYIDLNINLLTGEAKHFNKKTKKNDYGFYYDLKNDDYVCEFGNCPINYEDIEIIKNEYDRLNNNSNSN